MVNCYKKTKNDDAAQIIIQKKDTYNNAFCKPVHNCYFLKSMTETMHFLEASNVEALKESINRQDSWDSFAKAISSFPKDQMKETLQVSNIFRPQNYYRCFTYIG